VGETPVLHAVECPDLETYFMRLLFCLFADDTGIFRNNPF
jgi:hypothetical protein